ncbi:MAG: hypothetical protein E7254_08250 [Lachnospiraceae bacterium]|nr:hypothetical protein [Lachnospiraceae bacterium]
MKNKVILKFRKITIKYILKNFRRNTLMTLIVLSSVLISVASLAVVLIKGDKILIQKDYPLFTRILAPDVYKNNLEIMEMENYDGPDEDDGEVVDEPEEETTSFDNSTEIVTTEPVTEYQYTQVDDNYFSDALFIGDSRVEGIKLYGGLKKATFYSKEGISLNKILEEKFIKAKVKKEIKKKNKTVTKTVTTNINIKKALKQKSFKKIYIMIGINELGYRTKKDYKAKYKEVVTEIRKLQPDAKIFIMGMMKVTTKYQKKHPAFKNTTIDSYNEAVKQLADYQNIFYIDMNENIIDKKGGVKEKYTWDGVHLKAEYYSIWIDQLKKHGVN